MSTYFRRPQEYYRRTQWTYPGKPSPRSLCMLTALRYLWKNVNESQGENGLSSIVPEPEDRDDTLRLRGSVIPIILTDCAIVTTFSAIVWYVDTYYEINLKWPPVIASSLGVVIGLILAFRTNTAYDRFWEGRKLWSNMDIQIRNFSRQIWAGMKETRHTPTGEIAPATPPAAGNGSASSSSRSHGLFGRSADGKDTKDNKAATPAAAAGPATKSNSLATLGPHADDHEKVLVINLALAYAVAVKHHLRQEFGVRYYDLEYLLPPGFVPCAATDHVEIKVKHDKALGDRYRHYNQEPWMIRSGNSEGQISLPLEIAYALTQWVLAENRASRLEGPVVGNLMSSINSMVDVFTNMERIVFTPIPLAYSIHLRQVVYLYCLALPFGFLASVGLGTIPLMALVAFTLFGIEGIGREIENPFGKDANDLHMDEFCQDLKRELSYIVNLSGPAPGSHH
ncbi:hypothetical protein DFQ27_009397 [Actinomortierella ambigua]|uniref:Uncharacterized protein n=1 Tax=Actinomortierella ambigua TaxID=1343610 RepID=A0A9P6QES3_9FUNG|nr:hypothetical protein DFQ27_009397 [Actinomortierella ambigua]